MCVNKLVHHWFMSWLGANTPFTQSLRPLCLPRATIQLTRSPLNAQRRQHGCLDRSKVVHRTFNNRHGRHGRHQVLNVFKTVAEGSARRLVAQRSLKWGRGDAAASPWLQDGCTMVDLWSPSNYMRSTAKLSTSMWATFLPPLCLLCASNSVLWMMTVTTTLPPFGEHGDAWASMSMVLPPLCDFLCLHTLSLTRGFFQGGHKGRRSSYTETRFSGFRRPLRVLVILWVTQRWQEGRCPVERSFMRRQSNTRIGANVLSFGPLGTNFSEL